MNRFHWMLVQWTSKLCPFHISTNISGVQIHLKCVWFIAYTHRSQIMILYRGKVCLFCAYFRPRSKLHPWLWVKVPWQIVCRKKKWLPLVNFANIQSCNFKSWAISVFSYFIKLKLPGQIRSWMGDYATCGSCHLAHPSANRAGSTFAPALWSVSIPYELG